MEEPLRIKTTLHLRSAIWEYYGLYAIGDKILTKEKVACNVCGQQLPY